MAAAIAIESLLSRVHGKRVGVIATPAGWTESGALLDLLPRKADVRAFLALEHGLRGELQDGVHFDSYEDPRTGIPVYSFYGDSHTFPAEYMRELDAVVFHAQDVSHRAYTYKQTLADTMLLAAETDTEVIVLDRPTPLGHHGCSGMCHDQFFPVPIPIILDCTLGELALWLKAKDNVACDLTVVPVTGWHRKDLWYETELPWVPPSPNIPSVDSVYGYACAGFLQHTTVSEGRGTCKPFEYIGAPYIDPFVLVEELRSTDLPGIAFRETYFTPLFNKFAGELCGGLHLIPTDYREINMLRTAFSIVKALVKTCPEEFHPISGFGNWFDGTEWTNTRIAEIRVDDFLAQCAEAAAPFIAELDDVRLYPE